ncbi:50S ribosomal protein L18 [bacterium]|nr:50S ribosomal protein L18 [bacterium]
MRTKLEQRKLRQGRVRAKVSGSPDKPRLSVFKSNTAIYAQIIDDLSGKTLVASSNIKGKMTPTEVGQDIAKKAIEKKIKRVVFDKGGYKYHGQVKDLADGAREQGLEF